MVLSDRIVVVAMKALSWGNPKDHPEFQRICGLVQNEINQDMDVMVRIAHEDAKFREKDERKKLAKNSMIFGFAVGFVATVSIQRLLSWIASIS